MDALKMLKTAKRYCTSVEICAVCEFGNERCVFRKVPEYMDIVAMGSAVSFLESWEREHPSKTRGELFLEQNPECKRSAICPDIPEVRPCDYDKSPNYSGVCHRTADCQLCRKAYWKETVE